MAAYRKDNPQLLLRRSRITTTEHQQKDTTDQDLHRNRLIDCTHETPQRTHGPDRAFAPPERRVRYINHTPLNLMNAG